MPVPEFAAAFCREVQPSNAPLLQALARYTERKLLQQILGSFGGGGGGDHCNPELALAHDDRPTAGGSATNLGSGSSAGIEVDLGLDVLVPATERDVTGVCVEPQDGRSLLSPTVAGHQRLVQGEAICAADTVLGEVSPAVHAVPPIATETSR